MQISLHLGNKIYDLATVLRACQHRLEQKADECSLVNTKHGENELTPVVEAFTDAANMLREIVTTIKTL